jgi:hypothetical protein
MIVKALLYESRWAAYRDQWSMALWHSGYGMKLENGITMCEQGTLSSSAGYPGNWRKSPTIDYPSP